MLLQKHLIVSRWRLLTWIGAVCITTACSPAPSAETAAVTTAEPPTQISTTEQSLPLEETAPAKASLQASSLESVIVPGESVGPVTSRTSRADLADLYGEAALEDLEVPMGEGFTESGTIVNADTDAAFSVVWLDETQSEPLLAKDFGPAWQTSEGIQIGTSFTRLQTLLGPFDLYGFGWDYGGTIVLEGSNLSEYYGLLILRLQPDPVAMEQAADNFQAVQGDRLISSDDPNLAMLNLTVDEMIVYLTPLSE